MEAQDDAQVLVLLHLFHLLPLEEPCVRCPLAATAP
jgi:hypothetical protein